jgi:hypothetical protein
MYLWHPFDAHWESFDERYKPLEIDIYMVAKKKISMKLPEVNPHGKGCSAEKDKHDGKNIWCSCREYREVKLGAVKKPRQVCPHSKSGVCGACKVGWVYFITHLYNGGITNCENMRQD